MANWLSKLLNKANPAQGDIASSETGGGYTSTSVTAYNSYNNIGIVNRCISLIADAAADVPIKLYKIDPEEDGYVELSNTRISRFFMRPNDQYDRYRFISNIVTDLMVDGNAFIYIDSDGMYHLPAKYVQIVEDKNEFVRGYRYIANGNPKVYSKENVIHIRNGNNQSVYRGTSKLETIITELSVYKEMLQYQRSFFENSALPKMILETDNNLSKQAKTRMLQHWKEANRAMNSKANGTAIVDGGLRARVLDNTFKDLDFNIGVDRLEKHIAITLGVPWVLLSSGNNANIRNNQRLFYQQTVIPIMQRIACAIEFHIYNLSPRSVGKVFVKLDEFSIQALRPDLKEHASYLVSLTNGGIITPNESRHELRKEQIEGLDEIRVPVNVAGSAADPEQGGAPSENQAL